MEEDKMLEKGGDTFESLINNTVSHYGITNLFNKLLDNKAEQIDGVDKWIRLFMVLFDAFKILIYLQKK